MKKIVLLFVIMFNSFLIDAQVFEDTGFYIYCEVSKKTTNYYKFISPIKSINSFTDLLKLQNAFKNDIELIKFVFKQFENMRIDLCGNKFKAYEFLICAQDEDKCMELEKSLKNYSYEWIGYGCRNKINLFDSLFFNFRKTFNFLPTSCLSFSNSSIYGDDVCIVLFYAKVTYILVDFNMVDVRKYPILNVTTLRLDTNTWILKSNNLPINGRYGLLLNIDKK